MRLGLLSMGLALYLALLDATLWSFGEAAAQTEQAEPTPAARVAAVDLATIRKQIVLRTTDGRPVPGITVHLSPAAPALGGPEPETAGQQNSGMEPKSGVTDAQGQVTFTELGQWVWMASFSGTFEGKTIQSVEEQGLAPYGRTRAGGGFPVMVEGQEEDAPATPVMVNGVKQPEVQTSMFVLLSAPNAWIPALDLALAAEPPQPLNDISSKVFTFASLTITSTPSTATAASAGAVQAKEAQAKAPVSDVSTNSEAANTLDDLIKWFYLLPMGVALLALYKGRQERKKERAQQEEKRVLRSSAIEGQEGEH